jgi:hypothetical protein
MNKHTDIKTMDAAFNVITTINISSVYITRLNVSSNRKKCPVNLFKFDYWTERIIIYQSSR